MRGFTLIETLVYIFLLSLLLTGSVLVIFTLATNSDKLNTDTSVHDEGSFVLRKLDWAFGDLKTLTTPASGVSPTLSIVRNDGTHVDVRLHTGAIEMSEDSGVTYRPLTTSNVSVSQLQFEFLSGTPAGIEASTTINGVVFTTRRYFYK